MNLIFKINNKIKTFSVSSKLLTGFLIVNVLFLFFGVLIIDQTRTNFEVEHFSKLEGIANIQKNRIIDEISHQELLVKQVASRDILVNAMVSYNNNASSEIQTIITNNLAEALTAVKKFNSISIAHLNGTTIASTDETKVGELHSGFDYFEMGKNVEKIDNLFLDSNDTLKQYLTGPLKKGSILIGVILIDYEEELTALMNDYSGLGTTGEYTLGRWDKNGNAVFLTNMRWANNSALRLTVSKDQIDVPIIVALNGNEQIFKESLDYRGFQVTAASVYIDSVGWGLIVKMDSKEAYATSNLVQNFVISIMLVSVVLSVVINFLIIRSIMMPINSLANTASAIANGDHEVRAIIYSKDEIGNLAVSFNKMTEILIRVKNIKEEENRIDSLGVLAGGIAHDFNNYLAIIKNGVNLINEMIVNNTDGSIPNFNNADIKGLDNLIERINRTINRAEKLSKNLLTFSSGGNPILQITSINKLFNDINKFVFDSNLTIKIDDIKDKQILVDSFQIEQVITNLLINAQEAMDEANIPPEQKIIEIEGEVVNNFTEITSLDKSLPFLRISIKDKGIGVSNPERIFEPFYSTKKQGRGIGLSLSYSIIKKHKGTIRVEQKNYNESNEKNINEFNTIFCIYLPYINDIKKFDISEETTELDKIDFVSNHEPNNKIISILVMDNEEDLLFIIKKALDNTKHFKVQTAINGEQALELFIKNINTNKPFDIVILDLVISNGLGGLEIIKELKKIGSNSKFIVHTGYSSSSISVNYIKFGFDAFIQKPYSMDKLIDLIYSLTATQI